MSDDPPRLLLLEVLNTDRYRSYRSKVFPYLRPLLREKGVETDWVCVGVPANEPRAGEQLYVYDLGTAERGAVVERIDAWRPTHVLLNERLTEELFAFLTGRFPAVRFRLADIVDANTAAADVGRWLGVDVEDLARSDATLEDLVSPDFRRRPLNRLAGDIRPFVHLLLGPDCVYLKPIAENPAFAGLAIEGSTRVRGCTFCLSPDLYERPPRTPAVELALRQIEAAERTSHPAMLGREYQVHGAMLWLSIGRFAQALADRRVPGSAFHFAARIDEVLGVEAQLESALPLLEAGGHRICLYNIGVESFSPAENERFNKGLSPEEIERGARLIARLEERFPETFSFTKLGGFGIILFTPWTTFDDLRLNVDGFRRHRIDASGFVLDSALQLLPGLAITKLAEADGLVSDRFEDYRYDSGCINDYRMHDVPWRFAHPGIATVYRLGRRLARVAHIPPVENLYAFVQRWLRGLPRSNADVLGVFGALLDVVEANPEEQGVVTILRRVEERLGEQSASSLEGVDEDVLRERAPFDAVPRGALPSFWEVVAELLARIYERSERASRSLRGFSVDGLRLKRFEDHYGLEADLSRDGRTMRLFVEEHGEGRRFFLRHRGLVLSYGLSEPPDPEQTAVMRAFLAAAAHAAHRSGFG